MRAVFSIVAILLYLNLKVGAQIVINEACTNNHNVIEDENNDESDWFELYNSSTNAVSLDGFSITDNSNTAWFFPDTIMAPGQFLLVFASGKNRFFPHLHTNFKLSKDGDVLILYNSSQESIDTLNIIALHSDHSFGNKTDGDNAFVGIFSSPTPEVSNNSSSIYMQYAAPPEFLTKGGFFNGPIYIESNVSDSSETVRFTLDGSLPTDTALIFDGSYYVDETSCIRAQTYSSDPNVLPSEIETNTYFIGYSSVLPVISICTNPENLWSADSGIYVTGNNADSLYPYFGANFWQDWEVQAHFEFYEINQQRVVDQDVGLSINGGSVSRNKPQKSFRITAKNKYGKSKLEHRFFKDKNNDEYECLVLRNASGDWNKAHFRDGCVHKLLSGNTNIDIMSYRPAAVFLNGQYWGVLNIRERVSKYYLQENYNIDPGLVDILEEDTTVIEGSFLEFSKMFEFITENDMSNSVFYDSAATMIDLLSFCDYIISETFFSNIDWPYNNIKYWKETGPGHRWRYLLIDLDITFGNNLWSPASMDVLGRILGSYGENNKHMKIFRSLLENEEFNNYFINRYADLINTLFSVESLLDNLTQTENTIDSELPRHFAVWGNDMYDWYHEIDSIIIPYINTRPQYALDYVQNNFSLTKQVKLSLDVWPAGAGMVQINSIVPFPLPWCGIYFDGAPITITAIPNPGFYFVEWKSENILLTNGKNDVQIINPDTNNQFIAFFKSTENPQSLYIYPNPADDIINIGFSNTNAENGMASIIDVSGKIIWSMPITLNPGPNLNIVDVRGLQNGFYTLQINASSESFFSSLIIAR